jgi:hypothetical protein
MATRKPKAKADPAAGYNAFKEHNGQVYTGMQVGRSHYWDYDAGEWKETKRTPDLWTIHFAVTKRRRGHAPKGSGVPVGTAYDWTILAQQRVRKLNANDYSTELIGLKFKLAHKRADHPKWSVSEAGQRKRLVKFLHEVLADLEKQGLEVITGPKLAAAPVKAARRASHPAKLAASKRAPRKKATVRRRRAKAVV